MANMARPSIIDRVGREVITKLPTSGTITVECRAPKSRRARGNDLIIYLPEVLTCAVSSRFRDLCKSTPNRQFAASEIFHELVDKIEQYLFWGSIHTHLSVFLRWLYGANMAEDHSSCHDRWFIGQMLGCPAFQNDSMRVLCSSVSTRTSDVCGLFPECSEGVGYLKEIWRQADFSLDEELGYDESTQVHWGNKQMLKFVLDVFAFVGYRDDQVCQVFYEGGLQALYLSEIILAAATSGGFDGAPWEEKNIPKYLISEVLPE